MIDRKGLRNVCPAHSETSGIVPSKIIKLAIYTRKSSEEGLELDFNSLDAQREACESYIKSQKHEGWVLVEKEYSDGGISSGTLELPALKELLQYIKDGLVDMIVVYKIDRLTRSLHDFSKLVEVFDKHQTSFVLIKQQFNTSTSIGRLNLNMLLSFAQFEREVTGTRIRDKKLATAKKGLWGAEDKQVLGINPVPTNPELPRGSKKLVPHEEESIKLKRIFELYLELKSVQVLMYRRYKAKQPSLLAGKLYDDNDNIMSPSHAVKKGKHYRYYISQAYLKKRKELAGSLPQVPANELEGYASHLIKSKIEDMLRLENYSIEQYQLYKKNLENYLESWSLQNKEAHFVVRQIIHKIVISHINIIYYLNPNSLQELFELIITKQDINNCETQEITDNDCEIIILPCELKRMNQGKP